MKRKSPGSAATLLLVLPVALALSVSGCATSSKDDADSAGTGSEFSDAGATAEAAEAAPEMPLRKNFGDPGMIHFAFDRSDIRDEDVHVLKTVAGQLNGTEIPIVISGYTDNRGTEEYNLALGERRAAAARRYLVNLGVDKGQMTIVSYGELRPLRRDNNEAAWSMNRRAQFAPMHPTQ